jgi:short-subunit dehydrogenase
MLSDAVEANARLAHLPDFLVGSADEVAAEGYRACMAGPVIAGPGVVNQAVTLASRATPKWLLRRIAGTLARRTG